MITQWLLIELNKQSLVVIQAQMPLRHVEFCAETVVLQTEDVNKLIKC